MPLVICCMFHETWLKLYILGIWAGLMNPADFNCMMQYFQCFLANIHLFTGIDNVAEWASTLDVSCWKPTLERTAALWSTPPPCSVFLNLGSEIWELVSDHFFLGEFLGRNGRNSVSGTIRKLFRGSIFVNGWLTIFFPTGQPERAECKVPTTNQQCFYPLEHPSGAQPTNTQLPGHPKMSLQKPFIFPTEV